MKEPEQNAIILLAAGKSSRMGRPKQLLRLRGKSLLRHAAREAVQSRLGPVVVILGAFASQMNTELDGLLLESVINEQWEEGMGSSIRCGVKFVRDKHPGCRGAIIMLCDQPYVDVRHLEKLVHTYHRSHKPIIASAYRGILGVPAYFHHSYFELLSGLEGRIGARRLVQAHGEDAGAVAFPHGGMDVDTPEDYERLKARIAREEGLPES